MARKEGFQMLYVGQTVTKKQHGIHIRVAADDVHHGKMVAM
jgi:fructose-1,6-bisphosphatase/sedoheptulose 1,7-bisphosphatase-like protein